MFIFLLRFILNQFILKISFKLDASKFHPNNSMDDAIISPTDMGAVDFFADAREAAVLRIVDTFRHPDDLANKLKMLRKKIAMERASVEAQLKIVMKNQLDSTQKGIDALHDSKDESSKIHSLLDSMNQICSGAETKIKNYAFIQKVPGFNLDIMCSSKL
jgi:hypothetical protein